MAIVGNVRKSDHLRVFWTGKKRPPFTEEHKRKLSEAHKGLNVWSKGATFTDEHRQHLSQAHKNPSAEIRQHLVEINTGKKQTLETRRKRSISMSGEKHWNWRGGLSKPNAIVRQSLDAKLWKYAVFTRDDFTCQKYGVRGGQIVAHHLMNFSQYPELRFAINNGITLSVKAHREFHKIYGVQNNTVEQMKEFLNN